MIVLLGCQKPNGAKVLSKNASCLRYSQCVSNIENLALFLTQPTVRTLRLLSCPPRLPAPMAQFPSQQTLGTRGDLRQNAARAIAVDPPIAPARTRRLAADSLQRAAATWQLIYAAATVCERSEE
jgi:hypothetical protein